MRETSKDSAARFFALKSGRKVRLSRGKHTRGELQPPIDLRNPPEKWRFVEKHVPGCFSAWAQTVGIITEGMTFGITGKPSRVVAVDDGCYRPGYIGCRCRVFSEGTWRKRTHPVVECCARKVFGDGLHGTDCTAAAAARGRGCGCEVDEVHHRAGQACMSASSNLRLGQQTAERFAQK